MGGLTAWMKEQKWCSNARHPPNQEIENSVISVRLKQPLSVEKAYYLGWMCVFASEKKCKIHFSMF